MSYLRFPLEIQEDATNPDVGSYCVGYTFDSRCEAIQRLVRPNEVLAFVALLPQDGSTAERVGAFMATLFRTRFLAYHPDPPGCDRWSSPVSTLRRRKGDCDDFAILASSLLLAAGCESASVAVGQYRDGRAWMGHAWVEGYDERGWFRLEATTGEIQRLGDRRYALHYLLGPECGQPLVY